MCCIDCRVAAQRLGKRQGKFTASELADAMGCGRTKAIEDIGWLLEHGTIRDAGWRKHDGPGRPAPLFECVPIPASPLPPRRPTPEEEIWAQVKRARERSSGPVVGRPKRKRAWSSNSEVVALVEAAIAAGWPVEKRGGHIRVLPLNKDFPPIVLPSSPSDSHSVPNARADLRRAGLNV